MKLFPTLALAACFALTAAPVSAVTPVTPAAAPDAAQIKATQDMLEAMQAEKLMRMTAGMTRYADEKQRKSVTDKLEKVPAKEIYQRLAAPVARLVSKETALEMTRFYGTSYGKKVLHQTYNSGPSLYPSDPVPTAAEKAELKRPDYVKADREFKAAEAGIRHEAFVLLNAIANK